MKKEDIPCVARMEEEYFSEPWSEKAFEDALDKKEYLIETGAGILRIHVQEDGVIFMEQNLPEYLDVLDSEEIGTCLDSSSIEKKLPIQIVSTGLKDILLPIKSEECLAALKPDFEAMAELSKQKQVVGVHAFVLMENADFAENA